jgi:hypothetical protein
MSFGAVEHELVGLSKEWMTAAQRHDRTRLEALLAKEFTVIGVLGEVDRDTWLDNAAGPYEIDEFAFEELDVDVYGSTAVLCSRYRQTARLDRRDLSGTFLVTDVWVRRDGRWQVVRRHATPAS